MLAEVQLHSLFNTSQPFVVWSLNTHMSPGPFELDDSENVHSHVILQTGGKGLPGMQSLYWISVSASGAQPNGQIYPFNYNELPDLSSAVLPENELSVLGQTPDSSGYVIANLPGNTTLDATPQAPAQCFTYGVSAGQIPVTLSCGGSNPFNAFNLSTQSHTVCVGQNVPFYLTIGSPVGFTNATVSWKIPGKFVNSTSQETAIEDTQFGPVMVPFGSLNYGIDSSLLAYTTNASISTQCWFVNGPGGTVSVGANLIFPGGQSATVAALGEVSIYRPQILNLQPYSNIAVALVTNNLPNVYLGVGTEISGAMGWHLMVNIDTSVRGQGFYVQLVNREFSWDQTYYSTGINHSQSTFGQFDLDNSYPYLAAGPFPVLSPTLTNFDWFFGDGPDLETSLYSFANLKDQFITYACFQPNGGIPVTIGSISWGWQGLTTFSGGIWSLNSNSSITMPVLNASDCTFPQWIDVLSNQ